MTMPVDLFQPSETPDNPNSAAAEWTEVLQDPKVRATMLSIGLQLMQPPSFGQTTSGQIAQGIGAGGETLARGAEEDRKEQESESKTQLNEARGLAATARANVAQAGSQTAEMRAHTAQERLRLQSGWQLNARRTQLVRDYQRYLEQHGKNQLLNPNQGPADTLDVWAQKNNVSDILFSVDPTSPTSTPITVPQRPVVNIQAEIAEAQKAIADGRDPNLVRQRFKKLTGQDLP